MEKTLLDPLLEGSRLVEGAGGRAGGGEGSNSAVGLQQNAPRQQPDSPEACSVDRGLGTACLLKPVLPLLCTRCFVSNRSKTKAKHGLPTPPINLH